MKVKFQFHSLFFMLAFLAGINHVAAQGTAFTYQGQLYDGGSPANGVYDMELKLFTAAANGSQLGSTLTNLGVNVSAGLFVVTNDFGPVFTGGSNWLRIDVRTTGASTFVQLNPRQLLTPTPYAIFAEGANASGLSGTLAPGVLSGTYTSALTLSNPGNSFAGNGSNLTSLNASQLSTGTVADGRLSGNVAFLNSNQTFTGANAFSGLNASVTVSGTGPISTSLFTGLGLQFYNVSGEGAILSSINDGPGFLTYYTKPAAGQPLAKQFMMDRYGGLSIDLQNGNNGFINNSTTNGAALSFGAGSGEGIGSKRSTNGNAFGLDFYTDFAHRMSITQGGLVGIGVGTNLPDTQLEVNGDVRIDGNRILLSPNTTGSYANDGLYYDMTGLSGINNAGSGPFLGGYYGGMLGALNPNTACLSWDASGDVSVNNNLSTGSLTVRGNYVVVNGGTPVYAYFGDDGSGNDVQIGSQKSGITAVSCYNTADQAYMKIFVSSITIEGGSDLAEPFQITDASREIPAGAVVVIDEQNPGHLKLSDSAYDTRVAGVVSGANGINPGIQMQQQGALEGGKNVALTGRVYVQADASNGAIKPGDLLTSSSVPGRAMKVSDHARAQGAILGKAMTGLKDGQAMVLVLVTLQ